MNGRYSPINGFLTRPSRGEAVDRVISTACRQGASIESSRVCIHEHDIPFVRCLENFAFSCLATGGQVEVDIPHLD